MLTTNTFTTLFKMINTLLNLGGIDCQIIRYKVFIRAIYSF